MAGGWRAVAKAQVKLAAFQSPALGIALAAAASPKRARTLIVSDAPRRPRQVGQRRGCSGAWAGGVGERAGGGRGHRHGQAGGSQSGFERRRHDTTGGDAMRSAWCRRLARVCRAGAGGQSAAAERVIPRRCGGCSPHGAFLGR